MTQSLLNGFHCVEKCFNISISSDLIKASDEDSSPNNQIAYSIVFASAFKSYFDITLSEGYGGECSIMFRFLPHLVPRVVIANAAFLLFQ